MVKVTTALFRVPVIKFRKGGLSHAGASHPAPAAAAPAPIAAAPAPAAAPAASPSPPVQQQQTAGMSTVSDMDLPHRYRRAPLTEEEIDHINGGGIV